MAQVLAENNKRKIYNESGTGLQKPLVYPHMILMPKGDRDLAVVALKERLMLPDCQDILGEIGRALAYLHSKSIVHADVKLLVSRQRKRRNRFA